MARSNVKQKPYDDQRVRNALQMAVDNATILKLGIDDHGTIGENHHVSPIHPEYYPLPKKSRDLAGAKKLMTDAGQMDHEHELITSDEEYYKNTGDFIAAQMREAGFKVKRTVLPGATFWNDWTKYPLSMNGRAVVVERQPMGIEVMNAQYIRTARLKGLSFPAIVLKHALRNALIAPFTVIMLLFPWLLTGVVIVEVMFRYQGFGQALVDAAGNNDIDLLLACSIVSVALVLLTQLISDVGYAWLNPRIRVH